MPASKGKSRAPFVLIAISAAIFMLYTWRDRLGGQGGFILVIGAIVGGIYLASLLRPMIASKTRDELDSETEAEVDSITQAAVETARLPIEVRPFVEVAPAGARLSQWQRVANIFSAPSKTFEDIQRGNKSWWLPLIFIAVVTYALFAVVTVKIGIQQVVQNQIHLNPQAEEKLAQLPAEQRETSSRIALYSTEVALIANPVLTIAGFALLSLGLLGTINFVFGGKADYASILAVWFYAALPSIVKTLLGIVVIYAGMAPESFNIKNFAPTNIGAFLDPLETNKALYALATSLDLVQIWCLVLLGIGTAVVAGVKRSSGYIAVFGWWAVLVLIGVGWAAITG